MCRSIETVLSAKCEQGLTIISIKGRFGGFMSRRGNTAENSGKEKGHFVLKRPFLAT